MKKLCALAASLIIGAASFGAQAGDRHGGHDHDRYDGRHNARHYDRDDWRGRDRHRHVVVREYRNVYYQPVPVYHRPVRYYAAEPYYGERVRYYRDDDVHGSITVGF